MDGLAVMAPQGRIRVWRGATGGTGRTFAALAITLAVLAAAIVGPGASRTKTVTDRMVHVIVTGAPGAASAATQVVQSAGGHVLHALPIVGGFDAVIPASALSRVAAANGVRSVTPDVGVHLNGATPPDPTTWPGASPYDPKRYPGSMYNVAREINADDTWDHGYTGKGIGVALIDSGVAPVPNITANLVNGPDLSLDATGGPDDGIDAFGHGTHMAGIIAGREGAQSTGHNYREAPASRFLGIAPDAKVVSVKVATADGSVDVSQVIAGIDWVVEHRNDPGMNIRVLNLSFGTDGVQDYMLDPLTFAAEVAWRAGIVVVVAAGNNGSDHPQLNNPAYDPYVIAVGAQDQNDSVDPGNDVIADFSSRGNSRRRPDLVTPGRSIVSLRDPGSLLDGAFPTAQVGDDEFKGSGTSQSAAVLSGAIALLLQRYPNLTPDQVKAMLNASGRTLKTSSGQTLDQGMKTIDVNQASSQYLNAVLGKLLGSKQNYPQATGLGSIDAARGSFHLVDADSGAVLEGEIDVTGAAWDPATWSAAALDGRTWSGDSWMGRTWSGRTWSGRTWSGRTWSGDAYNGRTWSGRTWSGGDWAGRTWSGRTWSGRTWSSADLDPTADSGA